MGFWKKKQHEITFQPEKQVVNNYVTNNYITKTISGNPNPSNFKILEVLHIGRYFVSEIKYPDCYNFEGRKVLLNTFDPRNKSTLDPHFEQGSGILARFEPSVEGWELAKKCAKILT